MSVTSEIISAYFQEVFSSDLEALLEIEKIGEELVMSSQGIMYLTHKQHVNFMGEFTDAFNEKIGQLADRQKKLENEINKSQKHAKALEQSNMLLRSITRFIPQQIIVVALATGEILMNNDLAKEEIENDPDYISKILKLASVRKGSRTSRYAEIEIKQGDRNRYLTVNSYFIEWNKKKAVTLVVNDISKEKIRMKELEEQAYIDGLTNKYNRFYGMLTLNEWVEEKKYFTLVFVDLDNLKYVNDRYGHNEGDEYIKRVSDHLATFSADTVLCRIGGDELMLLIPGMDSDETYCRMAEISVAIENDNYLQDENYFYSISMGVITINEHNNLPSSSILSIADERMYEHKRAKKIGRRIVQDI